MELIRSLPITPSRRHRVTVKGIKNTGWKPLIKGKPATGFRNNTGRVTVRHRGNGHKRNLRLIDLMYLHAQYSSFEVLRLDYDPTRSSWLFLCRSLVSDSGLGGTTNRHLNQKYFYRLATDGIKTGTIIKPKEKGNCSELGSIALGVEIHSIEKYPGIGAIFTRAAGTYSKVLGISKNKALVLLPSNKKILLPLNCKATLGRVSNPSHSLTVLGKAGASRWLGRRPIVRGEVMNPIDHPHGGKTRGGRPIKNIFGVLAKWRPTSTSSQRSNLRS